MSSGSNQQHQQHRHQQQAASDGLSVTIAASAHTVLQNSPHIIHAISVSQPVQSWTVIRDHVDFQAMDNALAGLLHGRTCPPLPKQLSDGTAAATNNANGDGIGESNTTVDVNLIVQARNGAQEWLAQILAIPAARESPVMRQFLCYGVNIVPPQFEGIGWVNFNTAAAASASAAAADPPQAQHHGSSHPHAHAHAHGGATYASIAAGHHDHHNQHQQQQHPTDEMDMDEMFAFENDNHPDSHALHHTTSHLQGGNANTLHHHQHHQDNLHATTTNNSNNSTNISNIHNMNMNNNNNNSNGNINNTTTNNNNNPQSDPNDYDSETEYYTATNRYQPTEYEPLTPNEIMEMNAEMANEVEMIEDVGSLAQSLGASHLGRSLGLQKEMQSYKQGQMRQQMQQRGMMHNNNNTMGGGLPGYGEGAGAGAGGVAIGQDTGTGAGAAANTTSGGIGDAMAKAENDPQFQPHVEGLGDSFYRKAPVCAPRLDSFKMIKVIGKGSFGKVFLVKEKQTNEMFALKVLKKDNIIKRNQVEHTKTERSVLGYVKHPFIVGLNMAFQSKDKLYFVLDYCAGGELFFHLGKVGKFSESRAMFYAAEITLAIAYVHDLDIVYRDLKPENVLLDSRGHVRLTDFGLSKEGISNSSSGANSFCGTPEYLAPEILNRQGHGRAVDWWSLGALLYEMLTGLPPFYCRDREKLFEKIRKGVLDYPRYLSPRAMLILRGLLTKDPRKRLGSGPNDAEDIKKGEFFEELDWVKLMNGDVPPPWDPQINGSMDTSQFDHEFTNMPLNSPGAFQGHGFGTTPADNVFEGFTFTDRSFYYPPSHKT